MRSLVQAFALFQTAIANAIGEALVALSADPLLTWNYTVFAVLSFVGGVLFWLSHRNLDRDEDLLNQLPTGHVGTAAQAAQAERRASLAEIATANEKLSA